MFAAGLSFNQDRPTLPKEGGTASYVIRHRLTVVRITDVRDGLYTDIRIGLFIRCPSL